MTPTGYTEHHDPLRTKKALTVNLGVPAWSIQDPAEGNRQLKQ